MGTVTLERVATEARSYPDHLLDGCGSGLCLFSAAFLGWNDAIHFALEGIQTTCVDIDGVRLAEMEGLYPESWSFFCDDAWEFAERWQGALEWDAVSVDTFTGDAMHRSLASLELWCSLARKIVTVTITSDATDSFKTPQGWSASLYRRSEEVYWLVLTHD